MKVIIDRFEGNYAVVELEDRNTVNMPKKLVPPEAKEGDVIEIRIDHQETELRRKYIQQLMKDIWEEE